MNRVTLTIHLDLPDGVIPDVAYAQVGQSAASGVASSSPPAADEPPFPTEELPAPSGPRPQAEAQGVPSCPSHGPMTYHAAGPNKAGTKQLSASYRCDHKDGDTFCPTKPKWLG